MTKNYAEYDVIEILITDLAEAAKKSSQTPSEVWAFKLQQLEDMASFDDGFTINRPRTDASLEDAIPKSLNEVIKLLSANGCKVTRLEEPISAKEATLLHSVLQHKLEQFSTTSTQDTEILESLTARACLSPGVSSKRYEMAVQVRKGEKEICEAIIDLCKKRMKSTPSVANATRKRVHSATSNAGQANKQAKFRCGN